MPADPDTEMEPSGDFASAEAAGGESEALPRRRRRPRSLPPPPDDPELRAPYRVFRARRERLIGGVCAGFARAWRVDPALVRGLTVLACFVGGAGILAYLAALFLLPLEPRALGLATPPGASRAPRQDLSLVWAGLVLVALAIAFLSWLEVFHFRLFTLDRGALWPAILIALALIAVGRRRTGTAAGEDGAARHLTRPRHDRLVFGVASGFARYALVDTNIVRLVFIVIALWSYGIGILLYALLAAFLPLDRSDSPGSSS